MGYGIKMMTQTEQVMDMLDREEWVCGVSFQQEFIPTYAQRISDLNKKGHKIEGQKCDMFHHSHRGNVFMYSLIEIKDTLF